MRSVCSPLIARSVRVRARASAACGCRAILHAGSHREQRRNQQQCAQRRQAQHDGALLPPGQLHQACPRRRGPSSDPGDGDSDAPATGGGNSSSAWTRYLRQWGGGLRVCLRVFFVRPRLLIQVLPCPECRSRRTRTDPRRLRTVAPWRASRASGSCAGTRPHRASPRRRPARARGIPAAGRILPRGRAARQPHEAPHDRLAHDAVEVGAHFVHQLDLPLAVGAAAGLPVGGGVALDRDRAGRQCPGDFGVEFL